MYGKKILITNLLVDVLLLFPVNEPDPRFEMEFLEFGKGTGNPDILLILCKNN